MSSNIVNICGQEIERIEYKRKPVITFKMMDKLHQRSEGRARKTFHEHKNRLIENDDFFKVPYKELSKILTVRNTDSSQTHNKITFLTQTGYLMLVKSFQDDRAWEVQRQLVNGYFVAKKLVEEIPINMSEQKKISSILKNMKSLIKSEEHMTREEYLKIRRQIMGEFADPTDENVPYAKHVDIFSIYINERIEYAKGHQLQAIAIYNDYTKWSDDTNQITKLPLQKFGSKMKARFDSYKSGVTYYTDVKFKAKV